MAYGLRHVLAQYERLTKVSTKSVTRTRVAGRATLQTVTKPKDLEPIDDLMRRNLVRFIDESGYSQLQVADMAGIPQANLGRYCRGENAVPANILPVLATVFGRTVSDFFASEPPPGDIESAPPVFLKRRPGATWTDEDQRDADEFLERLRSRRLKKKSTKKV